MLVSNKKSLIVYYSRKGQNYMDGRIINLPIGNTEVIAKKIKEFIGGDLFEINTVKPYPIDYTETTNVAREEFIKMHVRNYPILLKIWMIMM